MAAAITNNLGVTASLRVMEAVYESDGGMTKDLKKLLVYTLVFISIFANSHALAAENEQARSQLLSFFKSSVYTQTVNDKNIVFRWSADRILCTYGDPSPADLDTLVKFTYAINKLTNLNIRNFFRKNVQACPGDTQIYFSFRKPGEQTSERLQDEVTFVDQRSGFDSPATISRLTSLGYYMFKLGGGHADYIFIALPSFGEEVNLLAGGTRNELIEKSLFQMLSGIKDTSPLQKFPTSFKDPLTTLPVSLDAAFLLKANRRQQNLCLLDIMLLYSLYKPKPKQNLVPMPMDYHLDFIRSNFNEIRRASKDIFLNPDFKELFPKKC